MKHGDGGSSSVKGPVDFTGYWALVKHEQMDEFLKALGGPWVVRKAALKFGGSAVDVISHAGSLLRVTSLNAKGSWSRSYDVDREVMQKNAEGTVCKTTAWWEGRVLRSRLEGSQLGVLESWRYMRGNCMAVRTSLRPAKDGAEAVMFWFFDRMETLQRHVARGGGGSLLQQVESDQRHVERATRKDTQYIQDVLLDWQRWKSPADDFIHVVSPPPIARPSRQRRQRSPGSGSPAHTMSPVSMSKSPSNDSLSALPAGLELRSEGKSIRSESRSRLAESDMSNNALDRMARQAAALALTDDAGDGTPPLLPPPHVAAASRLHSDVGQQRPAAVEVTAVPPQQAQQVDSPGSQHSRPEFHREISLSYPRESAEAAAEAAAATAAAASSAQPAGAAPGEHSITFRPPSSISGTLEGAGSGGSGSAAGHLHPMHLPQQLAQHAQQQHPLPPPVPDSDVATRGSANGSVATHPLPSAVHHQHQHTGSSGSAGGAPPRSVHYKSLSAESTGRGGWGPSGRSTPGRASPRSTSTAAPLSGAEQLMAFRMHEFDDGRGIAAVVPVSTPNDTSEPQLLSMSPEQAEETAAKLRELEADMLLARQENRRGVSLCGCLVISLASNTLPDHLRVWEMTLS